MKLDERFEGFKRTPVPDLWPEIERREPVTALTPVATGWRRLAIAAAALVIGAAALFLVIRAFPPHDGVVPSNPTAANGVIAYAPIGKEQVFWTITSDGSEKTQVPVDVPGFVGVPSWSPDGSEIAFSVNSEDEPHPEGGNWDIYVASADGSDPKRLTTDRVDHSPAWSPDGAQIAYVYGYGDDQQIRVMNADGSDMRELTSDHGFHSFPTWSPDGTQIAYVAFDGTNANIYVMNADGSGSHRVTDDPAHEDTPAWSPDGRVIAFTSEGGSRDPGVYTVSPDGTEVAELAHDPDPANLGIAWSPDGMKMALVSIRGPGNERNVYVLDVASGELATIGQPGAFWGVSWQPVPVIQTNPTTQSPNGPIATGTLLVSSDPGSGVSLLAEIDVATGARTTIDARCSGHLAVSSDATRMACDEGAEGYGQIDIISLSDGEILRTLRIPSASQPDPLDWSSDDASILFIDNQGALASYDLATDLITPITVPFPVQEARWSPNGDAVAVLADQDGPHDGDLLLMAPDGGALSTVVHLDGSLSSLAWSRDGSHIAFTALRGDIWQVFVVDRDGSGLRQLTRGSFDSDRPVWSPDGEWIAYAAETAGDHAELQVVSPAGGPAYPVTDEGIPLPIEWLR